MAAGAPRRGTWTMERNLLRVLGSGPIRQNGTPTRPDGLEGGVFRGATVYVWPLPVPTALPCARIGTTSPSHGRREHTQTRTDAEQRRARPGGRTDGQTDGRRTDDGRRQTETAARARSLTHRVHVDPGASSDFPPPFVPKLPAHVALSLEPTGPSQSLHGSPRACACPIGYPLT